MKLSGGALSGWYVPDVGDNRRTKEFRVLLKGATAVEYRSAIRSSAIAKAGQQVAEIVEEAEDGLVRANVTDAVGLEYVNETGAGVKIGDRDVKPGESIQVQNGAELVDALASAGDADTAVVILSDIAQAIRSRARLAEGLVPT